MEARLSALRSSLLVLALLNLIPLHAGAQTTARPTIAFNRWPEDRSVLADPKVPREPLDELKYISLSTSSDTRTYLSLGANVRERLEVNDAPARTTPPHPATSGDPCPT